MQIKRLTAVSVFAAALFVMAPVQATTSKTHGKSTHAKHAPHKQTHTKSAHHKVAHGKGKVAQTKHKASYSRPAAPDVGVASAVTPAITYTVAVAADMKPMLPRAGALQSASFAPVSPVAAVTPSWLSQAPAFSPTQMLTSSTRHNYYRVHATSAESSTASNVADMPTAAGTEGVTGLRKSLISLAMNLRDIRYTRGGRDPSTGFDCSGFVRYVFAHAIGMQLPTNSASQFLAGLKVSRADMKPGDLVFFRTHGKQRNISHVGIYISGGRFIHSPASGKSVQISSLDEAYWSKHFAGAKRPEAMALLAHNG